jgi:hypothetical protein
MSKLPETWLTEKDMERIWKVVHNELSECFVSEDECIEFSRVIDIIGKQKLPFITFLNSTLQ